MFCATTYGRVAIRPARVEQRRIAVGQGEPLGSKFVRGADDVHIDARSLAEASGVDGLQTVQPLRDAFRDRLLAGSRAILEFRLEAAALVLVDAETGRALGIVDQQLFGILRDELIGRGVGVFGCARRQMGQGNRSTGACNELAAARGHRSAPVVTGARTYHSLPATDWPASRPPSSARAAPAGCESPAPGSAADCADAFPVSPAARSRSTAASLR